tara:strand:- start:416 stop:1075 length:660 start_codon:yes stop_codon:yes gene_type:complete
MPKIDARFIEKKTPIFTTIIDDYESINKHVKKHILAMKKEFPEGIESNVRAWVSHWFTHKVTKVFDPLVDVMTSACNYVSSQYYHGEQAEFEPFNFWVMDYEDGDETLHHNHYPASFSVVYYVDVEEGCAPLIVEGESIQPKNGMLVVFPGHLDHEVPPTKGRRMAASGNFHLKPIDIFAEPPEGAENKFKEEGFQRKVAARKKEDFYTKQNKPLGFKS